MRRRARATRHRPPAVCVCTSVAPHPRADAAPHPRPTAHSSLVKQPPALRAGGILLPSVLLVIGGALGGALSVAASASPAAHTGLLAFGVAALLYLVTEELLLEVS